MSPARSARLPKYKKLAKTLINKIESGRLSIGDKLPGELDLMAQYKVSRFTVREAMRVLQQAGRVSRARGSGTVVTSERPFRLFLRLGSFLLPSESIQRRALTYYTAAYL